MGWYRKWQRAMFIADLDKAAARAIEDHALLMRFVHPNKHAVGGAGTDAYATEVAAHTVEAIAAYDRRYGGSQ